METRVDQKAVVRERRELSPTCFALRLDCPHPIAAAPGQFVMVRASSAADPLLRRPFSVSAIRHHHGGSALTLIIKEVGRVTAMLRAAPLGSEVRVLGPLGKGFDLDAAGPRPVLVAGGIGLPPVLFAARELAERGVVFDFFFGATTSAELIAKDEVRDTVTGAAVLCTDDGSFGETGLVTEVLRRRWRPNYTGILACGPNAMLRAVAALGREKGVDAELSLEEPMACGVGVCLGCVVPLADGTYAPSCQKGPVFRASQLGERW